MAGAVEGFAEWAARSRSRSCVTAFLLIGVLLASGCSWRRPTGPPEALSRWLYRTQGFVPVFPPREDVRVGDVHIYLSDPDAGDLVPLYAMPRWSALPTGELLAARARDRAPKPETPTPYLWTRVPTQERTWPEATADPTAPGAGLQRLPSIQLPSFTVYKGDVETELPPAWGILVSLDELQDWLAVRIGIEAAESSSLALQDAIGSYLERRGGRLYLPESLRRNLRVLDASGLETLWVRIVSEVIYMRALRLTIVRDPPGLDLGGDDVTASGLGDAEADAEAKGVGEDLDPSYAAMARADAMNERLIASGADVLPDGFVRFLRVSDDFTTARRVFRRATAIGVGGLSLQVDARTGEVEGLRLMGRPLARAAGGPEDALPGAIDATPATPLSDGEAPQAEAAP